MAATFHGSQREGTSVTREAPPKAPKFPEWGSYMRSRSGAYSKTHTNIGYVKNAVRNALWHRSWLCGEDIVIYRWSFDTWEYLEVLRIKPETLFEEIVWPK